MEVNLGGLTCEAPELVAPEGGLLELFLDFGGLSFHARRSATSAPRYGPEGAATPLSTHDLTRLYGLSAHVAPLKARNPIQPRLAPAVLVPPPSPTVTSSPPFCGLYQSMRQCARGCNARDCPS